MICKTINKTIKGQSCNNKNNIYSNKTHPEEIVNYFNNYFAKITTNNLNEINELT